MTTETEKVFHCCPYCKEVFLSYVRLDDHMRWEHSLEEIDENFVIDDFKEQVFFECDGRFFHDEKDLQQHIRSRLMTGGLNRQPLKALGTNQANNKQLNSNSQQQQPQKLVKNAVESILGTSVGAPSIVVDPNGVPVQVTSLGSMGSTLHLPEAVAAPVVHSVVGGTGDELAKAVESILGTSGDVDMDDINKMAAGAVISGAIDPDDANVVIEDSGVIVETDAAVSALLGQQQPIKMHNGGALPVAVHQTVVNGFPVSMDDDSDSDDSDEDEEEDFEPKPIPIQPPQMKAAALINGIKAGINGPI